MMRKKIKRNGEKKQIFEMDVMEQNEWDMYIDMESNCLIQEWLRQRTENSHEENKP